MEEQEESARVGSESRKRERLIDVLAPYILCIIANFFFAGLIIVVKVSLEKGFSRYVLVPYGQAFGALTTGVLALLYERDNHNKISIPILRNIFFLGLLGSVLATTLYYAGLEYTSSTFTAVTGNLLPSITFLLAILCRMEKLDISQRGAQAKIVGTVVAFAGATLMTLYKGIVVVSLLHTQHSHQTFTSKASLDQNWLKGSFMLVISNLSYSAFYILQVTKNHYPAIKIAFLLSTMLGFVVFYPLKLLEGSTENEDKKQTRLSDRELCHFITKPIGDEEDTLKSFMAFDVTHCGLVFRMVVE